MNKIVVSEAYRVVNDLLVVVAGHGRDKGLMPNHMYGGRHLRDCRYGHYTDGYIGGAGAPCSKRCAAARAAVERAIDWMLAHPPEARELGVQVTMEESL